MALLAGSMAAPAAAQGPLSESRGFYLGLNAVIGGVSAMIRSLALPEPDPGAAFVKGALGGAVMYGGQRLVGTGHASLRIPGVQLVAIGANMARNAGDARPLLDDLTLPLYPFYLDLSPAPGTSPIRLSALATVGLARALGESGRFDGGLDWKETLLAGTPVFRSEATWIYPLTDAEAGACINGEGCSGAAAGMHRLGTIWYTTGGRGRANTRRTLNHEMIHLTQFVRDGVLHAVPASDAALKRIGGPAAYLSRWVVLDLALPLSGIEAAFTGDARARNSGWYEREAVTLSGGH